MDEKLKRDILSDKQIRKFTAYGFLKNLKFFEPYLIIYLLGNNLTLFQIGILISIKEIIVNVFEIPSGFVADYFGKKKELCACFIFYIISFIFFFFSRGFYLAMLAMIFFGLGEAFRSGTHKAMIYTYLEQKSWQNHKTFVYGKTRSGSLIGSAVSSILGIIIILNVPSSGYIFLLSTIPYILDFMLILSYPNELDRGDVEISTFSEMIKSFKHSLIKNKELRVLILNESIFEASIAAIKDFVQPIMKMIIIGSGFILIQSMNADQNLKLIIGLVYAIINIFSAVASKKAYLLKKEKTNMAVLNILYVSLIVGLICLGIFIDMPVVVVIIFIIINLLLNLRKPIFVDEIDNHMAKKERATMLSVSSQMKSLMKVFIAPMVGFIADTSGIHMVMYFLAGLLVFFMFLLVIKNKKVEVTCRSD